MAGFTSAERSLLLDAIAGRPDLADVLRALDSGEGVSIDQANLLRDAVGHELTRTGIDPELGAVNDRGRHLDDLIDRIAQISGMWKVATDSPRVDIVEEADGTWTAECLVCGAWITTRCVSRREAEQKFGRHLQNDPHPVP